MLALRRALAQRGVASLSQLGRAGRAAQERSYASAPMLSHFLQIGLSSTASNAWEKSCYFKIDFKIDEDASVYEAVQRFAAYNIGCLVVVSKEGKVAGIISERDYVTKVALLGRKSVDVKVSEICTSEANMVVANTSDSVQDCMGMMLARDIRHLPVVGEDGDVVGMLSVKDLIKELVKEKDEMISKLTDFTMGRGAYFEHV
eukprot:scaffold1484_cov241-Pinguiococcus_pyrenoidosus.AAC.36